MTCSAITIFLRQNSDGNKFSTLRPLTLVQPCVHDSEHDYLCLVPISIPVLITTADPSAEGKKTGPLPAYFDKPCEGHIVMASAKVVS